MSLWHTTIGKKFVMAITGLIWFGYFLLHLWSNLKIYARRQYIINDYASSCARSARRCLVSRNPFGWYASSLFRRSSSTSSHRCNSSAATWPRERTATQSVATKSTWASRTMLWAGIFILLFVIYHLLDFTFGTVNPSFQEGNAYHNVVASFRMWYISLFYVLAMIAVGFHLYHGVWSTFQTLGWNTGLYARRPQSGGRRSPPSFSPSATYPSLSQ